MSSSTDQLRLSDESDLTLQSVGLIIQHISPSASLIWFSIFRNPSNTFFCGVGLDISSAQTIIIMCYEPGSVAPQKPGLPN